MDSYPQHLRRQLIPNGRRRAPWHDYRSRCIYMITLNAARGLPRFSALKGIPGNREWPPTVVKTDLGNIIAKSLVELKLSFPFIKILRSVIMPEHVHFVIFITSGSEFHLGEIISHFKATCTRRYSEYRGKTTPPAKGDEEMPPIFDRTTPRSKGDEEMPSIFKEGCHDRLTPPAKGDEEMSSGFEVGHHDGLTPPAKGEGEMLSVFEEGYHDRILLKSNQLEKMLRYVSDNPRRRLLRMLNPTFHQRHWIILGDGRKFEAYGNINLLFDPDIEAVKISRKFSAAELRSRKICWLRTVENGGVLASPFISKDEKRVLHWAINNGGRIIYIIDNGFEERFAPKGVLHRLCSEGRLLMVASTDFTHGKGALTRAECENMNNLAAAIATGEYCIDQ